MTANIEVRPAETLITIRELDLPEKTRNCICKRYKTLDEAIRVGREMAIRLELSGGVSREPVWVQEFISALDRVGLIRHDLQRTVLVLRFCYEAIGLESPLVTNEGYETFSAISDEQFNAIMEVLGNLADQQRRAVTMYYGLGERRYTLKETSMALGCSVGHVRYLISEKAFHDLRCPRNRDRLLSILGFKCQENLLGNISLIWYVCKTVS